MSGFAPEGANGSGVTALRTLIERGRQLTTASPPHELARWRATALCVLDTLTTKPVFDLPPSEWVLSGAQDAEQEFARGWGPLLGALEGELFRQTGQLHFPHQSVPASESVPLVGRIAESRPEPHEREASDSAVCLLLLGPVQVVNAPGTGENRLRNPLTELACWIYLHPGAGPQDLERDLHPKRNRSKQTRDSQSSRLRSWIGAEAFPRVEQHQGYRFSGRVTSDWTQFQDHHLASQGPGEGAAGHLRAALQLVRGRPFADTRPGRYDWAADMKASMTKALTDASVHLARLHLAEHEPEAALWSLRQGFRALGDTEPELDRRVPAHDKGEDAVLAALRNLQSRAPE